MNKLTRTLAIFSIAAVLSGGAILTAYESEKQQTQNQKAGQDEKGAKTEKNDTISQDDIVKLSEAFGHFFGRNLNMPGVKFDIENVVKGLRNGFEGKPAPMSDSEFEEKMVKLQKVAYAKLSEENLAKANEFLKENAGKPNVKEIEPGKLQYIILEEGHGPLVEAGGNPQINYTGKYIDGTVFGSSVDAGGPITIPLDQTIPGFSKGIQGMKEGEKRRLFVHPDLGYGTIGHLPPNSLLIFDIEVVKASTPKSSMNDDDELLPLALDDEDSLDNLDDDDLDDDDKSPSDSSKSSKELKG